MNSPATISATQPLASRQPRNLSVQSLVLRAWRRIQYPGGDASRDRLRAFRQRPRQGW